MPAVACGVDLRACIRDGICRSQSQSLMGLTDSFDGCGFYGATQAYSSVVPVGRIACGPSVVVVLVIVRVERNVDALLPFLLIDVVFGVVMSGIELGSNETGGVGSATWGVWMFGIWGMEGH